jgi:hypothetical protein
MSLEQKECKKITSSNEKGIDKFKVDALFAFFIDKKEKKRDGPGREKEGRSWKRKRGTVLEEEKEGRSWKKKKRDGPGRRKRGTVLGKRKEDQQSKKRKSIFIHKTEKYHKK